MFLETRERMSRLATAPCLRTSGLPRLSSSPSQLLSFARVRGPAHRHSASSTPSCGDGEGLTTVSMTTSPPNPFTETDPSPT